MWLNLSITRLEDKSTIFCCINKLLGCITSTRHLVNHWATITLQLVVWKNIFTVRRSIWNIQFRSKGSYGVWSLIFNIKSKLKSPVLECWNWPNIILSEIWQNLCGVNICSIILRHDIFWKILKDIAIFKILVAFATAHRRAVVTILYTSPSPSPTFALFFGCYILFLCHRLSLW